MTRPRIFLILLLALSTLPAWTGGASPGARGWKIGEPSPERLAGEIALPQGNASIPALEGEKSRAPHSRGGSDGASHPSLSLRLHATVAAFHLARSTDATRPTAERLPYHATAPPAGA
jgi:hypothetical protein